MTGFIRRLFKSNPKPPSEDKGSSFYLDADSAKSLGNINYMRTAKTIRRTFAQRQGEEEVPELVKQISSVEESTSPLTQNLLDNGSVTPIQSTTSSAPSTPAKFQQEAAERRLASPDMEMFRKMAKDLKRS